MAISGYKTDENRGSVGGVEMAINPWKILYLRIIV